jgi:hypothetical protein
MFLRFQASANSREKQKPPTHQGGRFSFSPAEILFSEYPRAHIDGKIPGRPLSSPLLPGWPRLTPSEEPVPEVASKIVP